MCRRDVLERLDETIVACLALRKGPRIQLSSSNRYELPENSPQPRLSSQCQQECVLGSKKTYVISGNMVPSEL